jgi:hypothetical protein
MDDSFDPGSVSDSAARLNDWMKDNWDTLRELARAGQLPAVAPSRAEDPDAPDGGDDAGPFAFDPVPIRARLDGWTTERQVAFIECLAESACVVESCRSVNMSKQSAYALRARPEAISFRNAWDAALDYATRCLADAVLSRAIKGVATPVFYQGEQIGERRSYDERLAIFLLQRRDPVRYGSWHKVKWRGHAEGAALAVLQAKGALRREDTKLPPEARAVRFTERLRSIVDGLRPSDGETDAE